MVSGVGTQKNEYGKAQGTDPHEFWLKQRGGLMAQMGTTIQDLLSGSRSREEIPPDTDCNTSEMAGPEALEIFNTFALDMQSEDVTLDGVLTRFRSYCQPRRNVVFERYRFCAIEWGNRGPMSYGSSNEGGHLRIWRPEGHDHQGQNRLWQQR